MNENYDTLNQIIWNAIIKLRETYDLNISELFSALEREFTNLGFRENTMRGGVENILIVKLDSIGDFVLLSPSIREIRRNYPAAHITLVVNKKIFALAELCPYANEVLCLDVDCDYSDFMEMIRYIADFVKAHLWKRKFDLGFEFRYFSSYKLNHLFMLYLSGAKERVGYTYGAERLYTNDLVVGSQNVGNALLTHPVINPKEVIHDCARNLYILQSYGLKIERTDLEVWYDSADLYNAKKLMNNFGEGRIKIAVGIGASTLMRKYPVQKYLPALKAIIDKGASIMILGGDNECADAKFLESNLPAEYVKNFVDIKPNLRISATLMALADMYIGNDTGTSHLAAAAHIPIVLLSREAKTIENTVPGLYSEYSMYLPWQTSVIGLRPEHPLDDCAKRIYFGGCAMGTSHCITQIDPAEIVAAYDRFVEFIKYSGVKKTTCPPFIKNFKTNSLYSGFKNAI